MLHWLQLLLERGADPNRARTDGYTLLFYAAEVGASAGSTAVMAALLGPGIQNKRLFKCQLHRHPSLADSSHGQLVAISAGAASARIR